MTAQNVTAFDHIINNQAPHLTARETEILRHISEGMTAQEIGTKLYVSKRTIDFHLANTYRKLQVNNRVQALRRAMRLGLIDVNAMV